MNRHAFLRRAGILIKLIAVPLFLGFVAAKLLNDPHIRLFRINPALLFAAVVVNQAALCLFAMRMRLVLHVFAIRISYFQSLRIHLQSMLYYFVVPMTVGLEAARFAKIKNKLGDKVNAANLGSALVGDRLIGAVAAAIWAVALLPVISVRLVMHRDWNVAVAVVAAMCAAGILIALLHGRVRLYVGELIRLFHTGQNALYLSLLVALMTHFLFSLAVYFAVRGADLQITFTQTLFAISSAMLFIVIPVSFAGVSPAEAAGVGVLVGIGIPLEQATIFALLAYFARLIAALEGGIWELFEGSREAWRHLASYVRRERSDYE